MTILSVIDDDRLRDRIAFEIMNVHISHQDLYTSATYRDWRYGALAEARQQADRALTAMRAASIIDRRCVHCDGFIELLDNDVDQWWVHAVHPADGHEATP